MVRSREDDSGVRDDFDVSGDMPGDVPLVGDVPLEDLPDDFPLDEDDEEGERAARRRRLRWYALAALAGATIVLVAAVGAGAWGLLAQRHASLATPDRLAGLALDGSADGKATADYLRTAVAASVSLDNSVGAVYDDPADKQRSVMFVGGTGLLLSPDKALTTAFQLFDDQGGQVTGVRSVPPGPLGGEMRCGTSSGDGGDMTVCGWADHGSIALALFPGRSIDEAAALLDRMRAGIQVRH